MIHEQWIRHSAQIVEYTLSGILSVETKRALETRIKEHRAATRWGETEKSAIAEHAWGHQHPILWEETSMLNQPKNTTLLTKEALHIRLTNLEVINRDEGIAIPECWQPVLDHATLTSSTHATPCRETDDRIDATQHVTFLLASN